VTPAIHQSIRFSASPAELYRIYIDPKRHAGLTGQPVKISRKPGSAFSAFGGLLTGEMVFAVPDQLIVQRWRSVNFKKTDSDSILILAFSAAGKGARIDLVHINVPTQDYTGVQKGWGKYYWTPLRAFLKQEPRSRK
jgi:activator of HSP90 ATPase